MTVYVDSAFIPYRRMKMCHMIADNLEELHAMADRIGVDRVHFQGASKHKHYDICKEKRALAIKYGAKIVTGRELIRISRVVSARSG